MTMNRHDIPEGRTNAFNRIQITKLWNCSDRAARHAFADFHAEPSGDSCALLSMHSKPAEYWRSRAPVENTVFIAETSLCADNSFLTLREARRLHERLNHGDQTRIDNSV